MVRGVRFGKGGRGATSLPTFTAETPKKRLPSTFARNQIGWKWSELTTLGRRFREHCSIRAGAAGTKESTAASGRCLRRGSGSRQVHKVRTRPSRSHPFQWKQAAEHYHLVAITHRLCEVFSRWLLARWLYIELAGCIVGMYEETAR